MERHFLPRLLLANDPYVDLAHRVRRDRGLMMAPRDARRRPPNVIQSTEEEQSRNRRRTAETEDNEQVKKRVNVELGAEVASLLGHLRLSQEDRNARSAQSGPRS